MTGLYQALVRFADLTGALGKPHHGMAKFHWQLDLNADGSLAFNELSPLTSVVTRGRQTRPLAYREILVPRVIRTRGVSPMLGADDISYVLGWVDLPERGAESNEEWELVCSKRESDARQRHDSWVQIVRDWQEYAGDDDPVPAAVAGFLDNHLSELKRPDAWTAKDGVYVVVAGQPAAESSSAAKFWSQRVSSSKATGHEGICVICGQIRPLVDTFPSQVKGPLLPNGQSSGVAPISINEIAYGYGLRKGLDHVPICMTCSLTIVGSLNYLLDSDHHRTKTADSAMVWWVEETEQRNPALIVDDPVPEDVATLLRSLDQRPGTIAELDLTEFHSLTVQGNAARMIVRDWTHLPVEQLRQNIGKWFADIEIEPQGVHGHRHQALWVLARCTGRYVIADKGYKNVWDKAGNHPHAITETLGEIALQGTSVPIQIASHLLQRIAADSHVDDARAAVLRLSLNRIQTQKERFMPGLDETNTRPCYLLGRLLSVYEDMQYSAATIDGGAEPNATFADKYMAGAIASPRLILTAGTKQSIAWLTKLRKKNRDYYAKLQVDQIISQLDIDNPGPVRASIAEQAEFVLGYHHQRAHSNEQRRLASQKRQQNQIDSSNDDQIDQGE